MDYTAGFGRQIVNEASPVANNLSTSPANSLKSRTYPTPGGSLSMNISTGGPHILLFERDQQLVALLNSELQLAGYDIHTARTAVEVFDAIARFPIRLVLVNLAQAAAARREFWVALDTQRRGRGVQVLTFHCTNIAGYGPATDEPDERAHTVPADMEVDGMFGIINMINAIRSRIAVANTTTSPRLASSLQNPPSIGSQVTVPIPAVVPPMPNISSPINPPTNSVPQSSPQPISQQTAPSSPTPPSTSSSQASSSERPRTANPNHTDKIRAVIYPNQRTWSSNGRDTIGGTGQIPVTNREQPQPEFPWSNHTVQQNNTSLPSLSPAYTNTSPTPEIQSNAQEQGKPSVISGPVVSASQETRTNNEMTFPKESGLAQLSRMLQEHRSLEAEDIPQEYPSPSITPVPPSQENTTLQQRVRLNDSPPLSTSSMRASPIQDLPIDRTDRIERIDRLDRTNVTQNDTSSFRRLDEPSYISTATPSASPTLMSIATPVQPITQVTSASSTPSLPSIQTAQPTPSMSTPTTQTETPPAQPQYDEDITLSSFPDAVQGVNTPFSTEPEPLVEEIPQGSSLNESQAEMPPEQPPSFQPVQHTQPIPPINSNGITNNTFAEQIQAVVRANSSLQEQTQKPPDNALLLEIVQSLPAMPTPTQQMRQPQVHQGRATRSLSSVLLEGHLVPQSRLEVALNIQRMLRGVDMNYQLGEILLMFKLLTPDQLLAASLVSYGLITPAQISALGRIRQELHGIGLEYDLENLLILFRILTSEQLREVRSTWSS